MAVDGAQRDVYLTTPTWHTTFRSLPNYDGSATGEVA